MIQVKISKDINENDSKMFWGYSARQIGFSILAAGIAIIINYVFNFIPQDIRGFLTMFIDAPLILCGWVKIQGLRFEKWAILFFKSILVNKKRVFVNENLFHYIPTDKKEMKKRKFKKE